jgi:hypothetical protein
MQIEVGWCSIVNSMAEYLSVQGKLYANCKSQKVIKSLFEFLLNSQPVPYVAAQSIQN